MIIDAHAHIYPDAIAHRAAESIGAFYGFFSMCHDGTVDTLLRRMDAGGIHRAVVHSAAMAPEKVRRINAFIARSVQAHPDRLIGYATLHPDMEEVAEEVRLARSMGLKGVKIHNDMLQIALDDPRMEPIYAACEGVCPLLLHMGDDRFHFDNPSMIPAIARRHPDLRLICAHMGGYREWESAERYLVHENVYVDTSSSFFALGCSGMRRLIALYGEDRVLFGSDYPMWDPCVARDELLQVGLSEAALKKILGDNLARLLRLEA